MVSEEEYIVVVIIPQNKTQRVVLATGISRIYYGHNGSRGRFENRIESPPTSLTQVHDDHVPEDAVAHGQILEYLAPQPPRTHDQYPGIPERGRPRRAYLAGGGGSNSPTGNDPVSFEYGLLRDSRVESVPRCRRERGGGASRRVVVVAAAVVDISDESRLLLLMLLLAPSLAEAVIPRYRQ